MYAHLSVFNFYYLLLGTSEQHDGSTINTDAADFALTYINMCMYARQMTTKALSHARVESGYHYGCCTVALFSDVHVYVCKSSLTRMCACVCVCVRDVHLVTVNRSSTNSAILPYICTQARTQYVQAYIQMYINMRSIILTTSNFCLR